MDQWRLRTRRTSTVPPLVLGVLVVLGALGAANLSRRTNQTADLQCCNRRTKTQFPLYCPGLGSSNEKPNTRDFTRKIFRNNVVKKEQLLKIASIIHSLVFKNKIILVFLFKMIFLV